MNFPEVPSQSELPNDFKRKKTPIKPIDSSLESNVVPIVSHSGKPGSEKIAQILLHYQERPKKFISAIGDNLPLFFKQD